MTVTNTTGSPILRPEEVGTLLIQPVEQESVAMRACTIAVTDSASFRIPIVTDDPAAAWVDEGEEITPDDITLDEEVVTPPKVAGLTIISRELADDSTPAAAQVVGQGLARDIARRVDEAFFSEAEAPAPAGLEVLTGVAPVSAPATLTDLDPFAEAISAAEQVGAVLTSFVVNPTEGLELAQLKSGTETVVPLLGSDPTQPTARQILGLPLFTCPFVTAGTMWGIPKARVFVVRRSEVRIERSVDAYFSSDRIAIRGTMRVGFGFPHPAAVVKITKAAQGG